MQVNKIKFLVFALVWVTAFVRAEENKPPEIKPFELPTMSGKPVDWESQKFKHSAINELPKVDGDAIFNVINKCYPLKSGFGLDISLKAGATYKDTTANQINTLDSNKYYAGIVASMPLYSDSEIDKERKLEYQRRMQTTETIKSLLEGVANKRNAERLLGLYQALEKRAQIRIRGGYTETQEQITYLEKVAQTQGDLDKANAQIESSRLALIGQCRSEVVEQVNNYILQEIKP